MNDVFDVMQKRLKRWQTCRKNEKIIRNMRKGLRVDRISVISQNCIGGVWYHDMGLPFQSPTVNLFFMEPDFVKFAANLPRYLSCDLQVVQGEQYPIGTLDDISIHFMHYETCAEAAQAWERRKKRVDLEHVLILATDRNGFDDEIFAQWNQIPYPKVLFTADERYACNLGSVYYPQYAHLGFVPDLIPKREFYKDNVLLKATNKSGGRDHESAGSA